MGGWKMKNSHFSMGNGNANEQQMRVSVGGASNKWIELRECGRASVGLVWVRERVIATAAAQPAAGPTAVLFA
jgi:hypothetical protein